MGRSAILAAAMSLAALSLAPSTASARVERELTYKPSLIWNSAVRFVRVDRRFPVVEKDKETGYLLFEYKDGNRSYQASLEIIPTVVEGREVVLARVRIEGMPRYVEAVLADKLVKKLKAEYGDPPPATLVEPAAPPAAPEERAEGDEDEDSDDGEGGGDGEDREQEEE